MRIQIEGDLRKVQEVKSKKDGTIFYNHQVEVRHNERIELIDIFSSKNDRKLGVNKYEVDVRARVRFGQPALSLMEVVPRK